MLSPAILLLTALLGAEAAAKAAPRAPEANEQRDVLILLERGPLHLRLQLALEGVSLAESRQQYVERLVKSLDKDKDGKLSREEASGSPILRTKNRPRAEAFLQSLKVEPHVDRRDIEQTVARLGGELVAYRQDLTSSQNDLEVFKLLDADSSGVLEGAEIAAAEQLLLLKDDDGDECVSFEEFFPPPPAPDPMLVGVTVPTTPTPLATVADMVRDTREPLLPRRLIRKYDRNRDLKLSPKEIGWPESRVAKLDKNGDGQLDVPELGKLGDGEPDMALAVDLKAAESEGGILRFSDLEGKRLDDGGRLDYAKVAVDDSVLTFSLRNVDPVASAVDSAMRQFNALDVDANGYLSRDETALRIRFERGLFEMIDGDGDEKIFGEEMQEYVAARTEPAASTCRMNLYDTGSGFFMALDANADGRVSVRETREAKHSLAQLERDGTAGIEESEPVKHFHIEFVRGTYQLFGPSEQLVSQTPAFQQRRPTGPVWFQRMDRNNDGDLAWNEFLGPREVFHQLDRDNDGLIDPQEAAQAE